MADSLAAVVLAAGAGERLRPLTWLRPKVLCPVAGVPLVDHNLARVAAITDSIAVNAHHGSGQLEEHLAARHPHVHVSIEADRPLGTAGAVGRLGEWLDGRPVVVVNGDAWSDVALTPLLAGWDGDRVRVLVPGGSTRLGPATLVAGTLLPGPVAGALGPEPAGLYAEVWGPAAAAGRLELVTGAGRFVDCGTPAAYLAANLAALGRRTRRGRRGGGGAGRGAGAFGGVAGRRGAGVGEPGRRGAGRPRGHRARALGRTEISWLARSWPQAASMSVPRLRRTVAFTPEPDQPVAEGGDPGGRAAPRRVARRRVERDEVDVGAQRAGEVGQLGGVDGRGR